MQINQIGKHIPKVLGIAIIVVVSLACLGATILYAAFSLEDYKNEMALREKLTPLSQETIENLCEIFDLSSSDSRCNPRRKVYGYQFYGDTYRKFFRIPDRKDGIPATYNEVEEIIGIYNQGCETFDERPNFFVSTIFLG